MKTRLRLLVLLGVALALPPGALMMAQQAGAGRPSRPQGPCDLYGAADTPCVAAHSTTRALYASYNGPLYQVVRQSDNKILDIGVVQSVAAPVPDAGGYADAPAQDAFCANTLCFITRVYDQSGKGNHLYQVPPGTFQGPAKGGFDTLAIADMAPVTIGGHKAYGVYIMPGMGYRNNNAAGLAINDEPEGIYYVIDGQHYDSGCCFDYGNSSTNGRAVGTGTMETTYFGTSTTWGSGNGNGPWIMSDMEAGLFSGYNAKKNDVPAIDSWRFVTAVVDGGGGNKWDLRGGNAQQGGLTTYYDGVRPGSQNNNSYFPMHKKGGVLLGTGGDNGNGSSGTFYEGVMTTGFPTQATTDAVQANIVAARYDVYQIALSRLKTFTPKSTQDVTATFTNTTGSPASGVKLSLSLPAGGWAAGVSGTSEASKTFADPVAPGASVSTTFAVTSPAATGAGHLVAKAEWSNPSRGTQSETVTTRIRNAFPVKINEVQLLNTSSQFIELYNAGESDVDISRWTLINTQSQWASVTLATIPSGTKLAPHGFYLLGLATSGLAAPSKPGDITINVTSTAGFAPGQQIDIDGEYRKITNVGTPATPMTTMFIPVSTGPWLTIAAGSTTIPVTNATGFMFGDKIGIDLGGNFEIASVTAVGKAATQTALSVAASTGDTSLKLAASTNLTAGDMLTLDTGSRLEIVSVKGVNADAAGPEVAGGAAPGGGRGGRGGAVGGGTVELTAPLKMDHMVGVDVAGPGTGITFAPPTKFPHRSGEAVQALGGGFTLDAPLAKGYDDGTPIIDHQVASTGYQGPPAPNQWFGGALSPRAGSLALMDATGALVVDAIVYGSQQSNSSANGTIASPELATLEGDQVKGGCIAVVPNAGRGGRGGRGAPAGGTPAPGRSSARTSDGADTDSNCNDFQLQSPTPGAANQTNK